MTTKGKKNQSIFVLLSEQQKNLIEKEADKLGLSLSSFLLTNTLKQIQNEVREDEKTRLRKVSV